MLPPSLDAVQLTSARTQRTQEILGCRAVQGNGHFHRIAALRFSLPLLPAPASTGAMLPASRLRHSALHGVMTDEPKGWEVGRFTVFDGDKW
jgi:hypothetical protein